MQMTRELAVFKFNDKVIRRAPGNGDRILYCINDICAALGLKQVSKIILRLNKGATSRHLPDNEEVTSKHLLSGGVTWIKADTAGGVQQMAFTDEVGLYDIISKSRSPLAKVLYRKLIETVPEMRQERVVNEVVPTHNLDLAAISALAQGIIGLTGHVEVIQTDVNSLKTDVALLKTAHEITARLPSVPPLTRRNEIILFINKYMANHPGEFTEYEHIWNHLYDAYRLRTRRDIKREARASRFMSTLAYVQSVGEIDRLWVVARDLFGK